MLTPTRVLWLSSLVLSLPHLAVSSTPAPPVSQEKAAIQLLVGEQRLIRVPHLLRYSLGGPAIRAIRPSFPSPSDTLLIKGISPGVSDLWVWTSDGLIQHRTLQVHRAPTREARPTALSLAIGQLQEAEIFYTPEGWVLRGEIRDRTESIRVAELARNFKEVIDETELATPLLEEGESRLRIWLQQSQHSHALRVERSGKHLWLRGWAETPREAALLGKEARAQFAPLELDISTLPDSAPTVHFKVFLLEVKRSRLGALGISWPEIAEQAVHLSSRSLRDQLSLDLAIQALEGEGSARVLSHPELVVRAPGEAELFSGGEIPIRTSSQFSSQVEWKPHGLRLKLNISHLAGSAIRLSIETEVSHLSPQPSGDALVPAIEANRMKTQVDVRFDTPLFLCGLVKEGLREQNRGLPYLRNIPVLGALFGSEQVLDERTEVVAILIPRAAPPTPPTREFDSSSLKSSLPKGPVPLPRHWMSLDRIRELQASPDYPWNAVE